jgi:hypothetical protein
MGSLQRTVKASLPKKPSVFLCVLGSQGVVGMLEFLHRTATVDTFTLVIVALLSGWAGVLTLHVLSRTMLALVFIPGFVFGALVVNYLFEFHGIAPTPDRETNVVVACTVGIIAALFVLLMVIRISAVVSGLRVERHQFKRA